MVAKEEDAEALQGVKDENPAMLEEEDEGDTRCICSETDPPDDSGLYIQCEQCSVWQHGFCVGITEGEDSAPDKYWCEQCRPDLHTLYKTELGEPRSVYKPVHQSRRQNRRPRREDASSADNNTEVEEPAKPEITKPEPAEDPKPRKRHQRRKDSAADTPVAIQSSSRRGSDEDRRSLDRRRATSSAREEKQYQLMLEKALKESRRTSHHEEDSEVPTLPLVADEQTALAEQAVVESDAQLPPKKRLKPTSPVTSSEDESRRRTKRGPQRKARNTGRANSSNGNSSGASDIGINRPIKPRLPTQRTTVNEMRRRVNAILEFISRTQVELSQDQIEKQQLTEFVENQEFINKVDLIYRNYDESLKMMDDLTRKLLIWEKRYALDQ